MDKSIESLPVELVIPNKPEFLRIVRLLVAGYTANFNLSIDEIEDIKLAVCEACNNAILYAYGENTDGPVKIICQTNKNTNELTFVVKDSGQGFDLSSVDSMPMENISETSAKSGFGFFIIKSLMDTLEIKSFPSSGTEIIMKKRFQN